MKLLDLYYSFWIEFWLLNAIATSILFTSAFITSRYTLQYFNPRQKLLIYLLTIFSALVPFINWFFAGIQSAIWTIVWGGILVKTIRLKLNPDYQKRKAAEKAFLQRVGQQYRLRAAAEIVNTLSEKELANSLRYIQKTEIDKTFKTPFGGTVNDFMEYPTNHIGQIRFLAIWLDELQLNEFNQKIVKHA